MYTDWHKKDGGGGRKTHTINNGYREEVIGTKMIITFMSFGREVALWILQEV